MSDSPESSNGFESMGELLQEVFDRLRVLDEKVADQQLQINQLLSRD